jgi:hypothetical protein
VLTSERVGGSVYARMEDDGREMEVLPSMARAVPNRDGACHVEGLTGVARMARTSVRSGSLKRSVAGWIPLNHAV